MKLSILLLSILSILLIICTFNLTTGQEETFEDEDGNVIGYQDTKTVLLPKSVKDRNLVREHIRPNTIINNYRKYNKHVEKRSFDSGNVLVYVTPWNSKGYEIAETFKNKFTHVSPVWHQIKINSKLELVLEGGHNVDKGWMDRVRKDSITKIVPRYQFDGNWNNPNFPKLLKEANTLINLFINDIKQYNYDGIVVEGLVPYFNVDKDIRNKFIQQLYAKLQQLNKQLFIVIPPIERGQSLFTSKDFKLLSNHVDGFSLMTYDFDPSNAAMAPLDWVKGNIQGLIADAPKQASKLMMGLPMYGYMATGQQPTAVVSHEYINMLKNDKPKRIQWDKYTHEHVFTIKKDGNEVKVAYPTLLFLEERIQLARDYGCSISIWEIGQGLDYFYDLF